MTLPLMDREIPIVADSVVDMEFGSGAVKVTPAHDAVDFEIGERTGLEHVKVIGEDATMTAAAGRFAGLDRFDAREAVKEALAEAGVLEGVEPHRHSVGHCSRSHVVVEPLLSHQWFVSVGPLVRPAMDVVKDGTSRFLPERWQKNYFHWMENLHDWCVSRQLWWGHRIPAWYCDADGTVMVAREAPTQCSECGSKDLRAEDDVLDTWFSSALWPFSTLGWPEATDDMERFYPTSVLVTGFDIIFFWVARMLKMGLHFTGETPFADIVIHGLVRADDGRKMSKSIGNAVDPIELIEKFGADSLRLSLLQSAAPGHDIPFNEEWVDAARRFGNKLWNALRFAVDHVGITGVPATGGYPDDPGPADRWILGRLHEVAAEYDALSDDYRFSDAVPRLYNFAWSEVFDWYLEMAKPALRDPEREATTKQTLGVVLRDLLKLFHPIIPFVTEELWSELVGEGMIITAEWPTPPATDTSGDVATLQQLITAVRSFRGEHNLGAKRVTVLLDDPDGVAESWWAEQADAIGRADLVMGAPAEVAGHARFAVGPVTGFIALEGLIDLEAERPRLAKAIADVEQLLDRSTKKLDNAGFVERAPAEVVANEREKVEEFQRRLSKLHEQLEQLG
jgi:valyl-tRNA synthetase